MLETWKILSVLDKLLLDGSSWPLPPHIDSTLVSSAPFVHGQSQQNTAQVMGYQCCDNILVCVSSLVRRQTFPFWIWLRNLACCEISLWRGPHGKEVKGFSSRWLVKKKLASSLTYCSNQNCQKPLELESKFFPGWVTKRTILVAST